MQMFEAVLAGAHPLSATSRDAVGMQVADEEAHGKPLPARGAGVLALLQARQHLWDAAALQ